MSAEVLREAAQQIRVDYGNRYERGHVSKRDADYQFAVADWLDSQAAKWQEVYLATQVPSRGVDQPPGRWYRDAEWTIGRRVVPVGELVRSGAEHAESLEVWDRPTDAGFLYRLRAWWATWPFAADEFTA